MDYHHYFSHFFSLSAGILYTAQLLVLQSRILYLKGSHTNMLSINIPAYSKPSGYQLSELPKPEIQDPKDVLIKVHAASVNPVDDAKQHCGRFLTKVLLLLIFIRC